MKSKTNIEILAFLTVCICIALAILGFAVSRVDTKPYYEAKPLTEAYTAPEPCYLDAVECDNEPYEKTIIATVTGYNSVESQTDGTPCLAAGGYICGLSNIVACPRRIPLETRVQISGKEFRCMDRLAARYDNRFDIFFDKDIQAAKEFGVQELEVTVLN